MGQHYLLQASVFRAAVLFAVVVSVSVCVDVLDSRSPPFFSLILCCIYWFSFLY